MTKELEFLVEIVKETEKISRENFSVEAKGGESDLVTNLDVKIENFLISKIKERYPDFDIVSEEKNYDKSETKDCFIIDPIDGTINFANGIPLWSIQVACKINGKTVASVIDMPMVNELYTADESGAYLNGKKISVKKVPIKNTLYAVDGSNNLPSLIDMKKHSSGRRCFGAVSVSMAFVAAGRIHGASFSSDKPWDYEPGLFLIKKAGGEIMDMPGFHAGAMDAEFLNILKIETSRINTNSNIFILHSLNGDTAQYWGKNLKDEFFRKNVDVYMPDFPIRAESSYEEFDKILSTYFEMNRLSSNSVVVCHSIGNPYFIRFCREHNYIPKHYVAVAPGAVYEYPSSRNDYTVNVKKQAYLKSEDFEYGKKFKNVTCFYSDEDDGNQEKFSRFIDDFNATPIYLKGYNHFDGYHKIYQIPELSEFLKDILK